MKAPGRLSLLIVSILIFSLNFAGGIEISRQGSTVVPDGAALYQKKCAMCHDNAQDRTPPRFILARRAADDLILAMTTGSMKQQAAGLTSDEIRAIAVHVTGKQPSALMEGNQHANMCKAPGGTINLKAPQWNGWGRDFDNTRYQPKPGLKAEDVPKLKVKWAFAYPGNLAYGQPTIIGDRLYITSEVGQIYCLNAHTGCTYWTINVGAGVRSSISVGPLPVGSPAKFAAYFGDEKSFVHAVDAATGKPLWKTKVEDHPISRVTGAPVLHRNRIYVPVSSFEESAGRDAKYECCKFRGSILALDASTGKILWKSHSIPETPMPFKKNSAGTQMFGPAGASIWSAPTIDLKRKLIYAGTGNSYTDVGTGNADAIIAFDLETGQIKWVNQITPNDNFLVGCRQPGVGNCPEKSGPDYDFGSSPILRTLPHGKHVLLCGQKSGVIYALDPDHNGQKLWEVRVGNGGALGGIEWGSAADEENVYVAAADPGGPADKRKPGLTALKIATGEKLWHTSAPPPQCSWGKTRCTNAQSAAVTVIPGVVFSGTTDGHIRAYSTKDGAVIWSFDTAAQPYATVNGRQAKGGSLDAGGPTIANGMVYLNSGYGRFVGQPGNALLAFSVDGK
jgi:polyvinyl alcohol dehydrogenase (cytochrome)